MAVTELRTWSEAKPEQYTQPTPWRARLLTDRV
jgi:hypothetical protein